MKMTAKQFAELLKDRNRPIQRINPACIIAIDPGTQTGVARFSKFNTGIITHTFDFWEAFFFVNEHPKESTVVICENGGLVNYSFQRADLKARAKMIEKDGVSIPEVERLAQDRASRNIGAANEQAKLLISGIARAGFFILQVKPQKHKWSHEDQERFTGITKHHNQHVRDAIRMVYDYKYILAAKNLEARLGQVL